MRRIWPPSCRSVVSVPCSSSTSPSHATSIPPLRSCPASSCTTLTISRPSRKRRVFSARRNSVAAPCWWSSRSDILCAGGNRVITRTRRSAHAALPKRRRWSERLSHVRPGTACLGHDRQPQELQVGLPRSRAQSLLLQGVPPGHHGKERRPQRVWPGAADAQRGREREEAHRGGSQSGRTGQIGRAHV